MIEAGIYVRVSTQEQAQEGYSIGEQTERLQKYCSAMDWTVYKVYTDPGYSGGSMDRPALQQLIQDVKQHRINRVVVYKLDRLSRSQKDTLTLIEDVFNRNCADFVSMMENFDTSTPFGRAAIGILAVFAQLEREQIKERMIMGKSAKAKTGAWMGSSVSPIGYDYIDGKLQINEYEKMQVLKIYEMFLSGYSIRKIANTLNNAGYYHKSGPWQGKTIKTVLCNRIYIGEVYFQNQYNKGIHESIISEEDFAKSVHQLKIVKEKYGKNIRAGKATSYLAGLLFCSRCGAKYHRITDKNWSYYKCDSRHKKCAITIKDPNCKNKSWRMNDLDSLVFDQIRQLNLDPNYINGSGSNTIENRSDLIQAELNKIDHQISRTMDMYTLDQVPFDMLQEKLHGLTQQKKALLKEQESIDDQIHSISDAHKMIESFDQVLERGSFEEIRQVLISLIDRIMIDGEDVTIHWNF